VIPKTRKPRLQDVLEWMPMAGQITTMKLTTDDHFRLHSQVLFKPKTAYDVEKQADGSIVIRELVPLASESKLVEPRRYRGMLMGADVRLDGAQVAKAIREDRDDR
jgi:hypothetical protein